MDRKKAHEVVRKILIKLTDEGQVVISLGTTESAALIALTYGKKK